MKRILLIGSSGSGKSTIAPKIAEKLRLPLIHLDQVFWKPGWVESSDAEFRKKLLPLLKKKAWVMDGHFGGTQDLTMKYADTVVMFDLGRWICLRRVLWRILTTYGQVRRDMAPGCPEQLDWGFLVWIWNFHTRGRVAALERMNKLKKNQKAIILRSPRAVQEFFNSI